MDLNHFRKINQTIIYHSKPSSVIQLHVQQTNYRLQVKVLNCLLQLWTLKMLPITIYKQPVIKTPILTI